MFDLKHNLAEVCTTNLIAYCMHCHSDAQYGWASFRQDLIKIYLVAFPKIWEKRKVLLNVGREIRFRVATFWSVCFVWSGQPRRRRFLSREDFCIFSRIGEPLKNVDFFALFFFRVGCRISSFQVQKNLPGNKFMLTIRKSLLHVWPH